MTGPIDWQPLVARFTAGELTAPAFEAAFLHAWHVDREARERVPYAMELLFYEVDAYCADPALRREGDLDDAGLLAAARKALAEFNRPWPKLPGAPSNDRIMEDFRRAAKRLSARD